MKITNKKLKELLVEPGHITEEQFKSSVKAAKEQGVQLRDILVVRDLVTDENLGRTIADEFDYKFVNLREEKIEKEFLDLIPELVARSKRVIVFARTKEGIKVGMSNPDDLETIHLIEKRAGQKVLPYFATDRDLEEALSHYNPALKDEFSNILQALKDKSLVRSKDGRLTLKMELTIKLVDMLLQYGYQNKASDIHIEPHREKILIRFRIDGVLHKVLEIPKHLYELMLMRIKILSKMRIDEHRAAQDGKLRFLVKGGFNGLQTHREAVDVRVSIVPVVEGENIVMRLLSAEGRSYTLANLGLSKTSLKRIQRIIKNPYGMILVTGPTGSGKTTTLYSIMNILNKPEVHIATIEDPVEYDIEGVSQIQVNPKTNLTFVNGLRAIVRQDPDIIMVGEVRDQETADIAVNSALTGHLILSTLHTNDAATTLPRLIDMGIEPFLVSSTVNVAIAQRLVRKICEKCRVSYQLTDEEKKLIEMDPRIKEIFQARYKDLDKTTLYKGNGCKVCANTGFSGRVGIFEILEMTDDIKSLIVQRASSNEITRAAVQNGMTTMLEDGISKVLNGVTTFQEVIRVVRE